LLDSLDSLHFGARGTETSIMTVVCKKKKTGNNKHLKNLGPTNLQLKPTSKETSEKRRSEAVTVSYGYFVTVSFK
jgi:hypothetical protein